MTMRSRSLPAWAAVVMAAQILSAQTTITPPKNKYSPQDDVKLGREAAGQIEEQLPILRDDNVTSYIADIGRRLVQVIPSDLRHPEFQYSFKVVNVREINAFALPGGPMYVNRGMIDAATTEAEIMGSIRCGRTGSVVSQGAQIGFGTAFLRFSREYEKQADLLGAHMMARAGYDPRDMANMFKTIEA